MDITQPFSAFFVLTKVDEQKRLVYGRATAEEPDATREIMDYQSSKPNFEKWSGEAKKRSGGKSLGNIREMHEPIAAGKVVELNFNDAEKAIDIGTYCADDGSWQKILDGVLTGFSIGGTAKRFPDPRNPSFVRYTAFPDEISYVDSPCLKSATYTMIKADGTTELRKLEAPAPITVADLPVVNTGLPPSRDPDPNFDAIEAPRDPMDVISSGEEVKPIAEGRTDLIDETRGVSAAQPKSEPMGKVGAPELANVLTAVVERFEAIKKSFDDEKAQSEMLLKTVGSRVGIARRDGEPLSAQSGFSQHAHDYGDPANWLWPLDTRERTQAAIALFKSGELRGKYSDREWHILGRRITQRAKVLIDPKFRYDPVKKAIRIEDNAMADTLAKADFEKLITQLREGIGVAADQIAADPEAAKGALMRLLGDVDAATAVETVKAGGEPMAPMGSQLNAAVTTVKADGATTTATPEKTPASTPAVEKVADVPVNAVPDAIVEKVNELTETVKVLIAKMDAQPAPVAKSDGLALSQLPVGDLTALIKQATQVQTDSDPVLAELLSGNPNALYKAAVVAGTEQAPDVATVMRKASDAAQANLTKQFALVAATRDQSYFMEAPAQ